MIVVTSPIFNSRRRNLVEPAAHHRLPMLLPFSGYMQDGGLLSYGLDVRSVSRPLGAFQPDIVTLICLGATPTSGRAGAAVHHPDFAALKDGSISAARPVTSGVGEGRGYGESSGGPS